MSKFLSSSTKRILWTFLSLIVSVFLIGYLLRYVDLHSFVAVAERVPPWVLVLAFGLYLFLNFCRALRFRTLLDQRHLPFKILFPVVLYHNFLFRTLPFMTGEISYVVLLRRYLGQRASEGISSLAGARLLELLLVIMGGMVGILSVGVQAFENSARLVGFFFLLLLGLATILYFAGPLSAIAVRGWQRATSIGPWRHFGILTRIGEKLEEIPDQLERIRQPATFGKTLALSFLTYGSSLSFNLILLWATGIKQSIGILLLVNTMVMIAAWLPISLSGFGIIEGGWAVGLVALAGLGREQAATVAFFMHGSQVIATMLSGGIGLALLLRISPQ